MPIYEYICPDCNMEFELMRPLDEADRDAICPKCNSKAHKLISSFGSKTGSYIQPSSKPFRKIANVATNETEHHRKSKRKR